MELLTDLFTIGEAVKILRHLAERERASPLDSTRLTNKELLALLKVLELLNSLRDKQ